MYPRLIDFNLDLVHYKRGDSFSKDRTRQQPKTQRQFSLTRHKAALLLRQAPQFDTHPVQPGADSAAAEVSRRIIEQAFQDPRKGYHDTRACLVWSALAGGRGNYAVDWHPRYGVVFRPLDPRRLHITPGHRFLHDPLNPCTIEELPMRRSEVMRMAGWDVPDDLVGDGGSPLEHGGGREADGLDRDEANNLPGDDEDSTDDPLVTIVKAWYRDDPFKSRTRKELNADLPLDEWYFVDDATILTLPFDPENPIPPVSPTSRAPMRLVTRRDEAQAYTPDRAVLIVP